MISLESKHPLLLSSCLFFTHSHILCLPIAVCTLEYHLNLFSSCAGMLCLSLKSCSVCRGRIGHLNAISLSFLSTVFHCLLSCQFLQDNTNLWLQKVSVIEPLFGTLDVFFRFLKSFLTYILSTVRNLLTTV